MKQKLYPLVCITALVSALILTGCASASKSENFSERINDSEFVVYQNNVIIDPASNYIWEFFEDNPTTYYRFKLNNTDKLTRLPSLDQIIKLLDKISYQLQRKKDHGNLAESRWFENDCDFLTSSSVTTPEGEILYEVVHWNSKTRSLHKSTVTGGDLVVIFLLKENL